VKWRLFRHLLVGNDLDAIRVYRWHIERRKASNAKLNLGMDGKAGTDQYVTDAAALLFSMENLGFLPEYAVPVDPNGDLLGGAHRVACALALEIWKVPVIMVAKLAFAPPWGEQWFIENGMEPEDLERLRQDWAALSSPPE
jgi:hypothetical protein